MSVDLREQLLALISEDLAVCEAATGPWHANVNDLIGGFCVGTIYGHASVNRKASDVADMVPTAELARFIAAARAGWETTLRAIRFTVDRHEHEPNGCFICECLSAPWRERLRLEGK